MHNLPRSDRCQSFWNLSRTTNGRDHHHCHYCGITTISQRGGYYTCCDHSSCSRCEITSFQKFRKCWACDGESMTSSYYTMSNICHRCRKPWDTCDMIIWKQLISEGPLRGGHRRSKVYKMVELEELEKNLRFRNKVIRQTEMEIEVAKGRNECWWCKGKLESALKLTVHFRNCEKRKANMKKL